MGAALAIPALKTGEAARKSLTADIIVVHGKFYREVRTREPTGKLTKGGRPQMRTIRRLEPIEVETHVNPLMLLAAGAIGLVGAGIGLWMLGLGVKVLPEAERTRLQNEIDIWTLRLEQVLEEQASFDPAACRQQLTHMRRHRRDNFDWRLVLGDRHHDLARM